MSLGQWGQDRGTAMVAALVLLLSLTAFGLLAIEMSAAELRHTASNARDDGALYLAEAGTEETRMRFDPADPNYFGAGLMEAGPTYSTAWRVCVGSTTDPEAIALGCTMANTVPSIQAVAPFTVAAMQHKTKNGVIQCYDPNQVPARYDATGGACLLGHLPVAQVTSVASSGPSSRTVVIEIVPSYKTPFAQGIKGRQTVSFWSDACTDSYDSSAGSYPGSPSFCTGAGNQGHIGTDSSADGAVDLVGGAQVVGNVTIPTGGNPSDIITGTGTHSGHVENEVPNYEIPAVPGGLSCNHLDINNAGESVTLGTPGTSTAYCFNTIDVSGDGALQTQGDVTMYVTGQLTITGELTNMSSDPSDLTIIVTSSSSVGVTFDTPQDFHGALYAPFADVDLKNNHSFYGAIVANTVVLSNGADLHFDQALSNETINVATGFRQFTWLAI